MSDTLPQDALPGRYARPKSSPRAKNRRKSSKIAKKWPKIEYVWNGRGGPGWPDTASAHESENLFWEKGYARWRQLGTLWGAQNGRQAAEKCFAAGALFLRLWTKFGQVL